MALPGISFRLTFQADKPWAALCGLKPLFVGYLACSLTHSLVFPFSLMIKLRQCPGAPSGFYSGQATHRAGVL
jgi:hypothetical protein